MNLSLNSCQKNCCRLSTVFNFDFHFDYDFDFDLNECKVSVRDDDAEDVIF